MNKIMKIFPHARRPDGASPAERLQRRVPARPPAVAPTRRAAGEFAFDATPADSALYVRVDRTGARPWRTALLSKATTVTVTGVGGGHPQSGHRRQQLQRPAATSSTGRSANDFAEFAGTIGAGRRAQFRCRTSTSSSTNTELRALGLDSRASNRGTAGRGGHQAERSTSDVCVAPAHGPGPSWPEL
jgi:hypothetical protein